MKSELTESMKDLISLLIEQSGPDEIWSLYRDLEMPEVTKYIEENYM